jgi:hypothetical protein
LSAQRRAAIEFMATLASTPCTAPSRPTAAAISEARSPGRADASYIFGNNTGEHP